MSVVIQCPQRVMIDHEKLTWMLLIPYAKDMGFIILDKALRYHVRVDEIQLADLVVTSDITMILHLFGFDIERWRQGFRSPKDLYQFMTTSLYFRREYVLYCYDFGRFSKYAVETKKVLGGYYFWLVNHPEVTSRCAPDFTRETFLYFVWRVYPYFKQQHIDVLDNVDVYLEFRHIFNYRIVYPLVYRPHSDTGKFKHLVLAFMKEFIQTYGRATILAWDTVDREYRIEFAFEAFYRRTVTEVAVR